MTAFTPPEEEGVLIGVVMFGLLGDVLIRTPALRELRRAYPKSYIVCYADPVGKEVLELNDCVDEIYVVNRTHKSKIKNLWWKILLVTKVISRQFDLFFDFYGGKFSHALTFLSGKTAVRLRGGKVKIKQQTNNLINALPVHSNPYHMANLFLDAISLIAPPPIDTSTRPVINVRTRSTKQNPASLDEAFKSTEVLVSIGSGDPRKMIGIEVLADLLSHLEKRYGLTIGLIRNPGQTHLQLKLSQLLCKNDVQHRNLPVLSLAALSEEFLKCRFLIVPDTGLFHLGVGLGIPILGIFSHTNPELVRPEASNCVICFKPDPQKGTGPFNLPFGSQDLNLDDLKRCADHLIEEISARPT